MPIFMKIEGVEGSVTSRDSFEFTTGTEPEAGRTNPPSPTLMQTTAQGVHMNGTEPVGDLAAEGGAYGAIAFVGGWGSSMYQYAYSDPNSASADDVIVDGRIITGENFDSAL